MKRDLKIFELYDTSNKKKIEEFNANVNSNYTIETNYEKNDVDFEWLTIIEETVRYLDNILRSPNRFIVNEEEVVQIEKARKITVESIKHLSKHTNFIQEIEENGDVKPSKILNINKGHHVNPTPEEIYYDSIQEFEITTSKQVFYKNESINIVVTTKAKKSVNDKAKIYMFVDGKQNYNHSESVMNGRIQYTLNDIPIGMHNIQFDLYDDELNLSKRSNVFEFAVVDDLKKQAESITNNKDLELNIQLVDDKELIIDTVKNEIDKTIDVYLCLSHDLLVNNLYGKSASNDEIQVLKNKLLEPIILFTLFLGDNYDNIEDIDKKNEIILSFCNTFYITNSLN